MTEFRYGFLCPDRLSASGGIAVLYDSVAILQEAGYDAVPIHKTRTGQYTNSPHRFKALYTGRLEAVARKRQKLPRRLLSIVKSLGTVERSGGAENLPFEATDKDVLVVPEFMLAQAVEAYPNLPKVVFVQNSFSFERNWVTLIRRGIDPASSLIWCIGISDTCIGALDIAGLTSVSRVPVSPNLSLFPFAEAKQRKIAYMPRKRPDEALLIDRALRRRGLIGDYELVRIDGMTQAEVAQQLADCRFFISLMQREALGFPAMEAMAAGCVVIGYTGTGTEEYFDAETGIPCSEGDTASVVKAVEMAVADFEADPTPFEYMRRAATDRIRSRYSREIFEEQLRLSWSRIHEAASAYRA